MSGVFYHPERIDTVRVRVERTIKFVASEMMPAQRALGGETLEDLGLDPDLPLSKATTSLVRAWGASEDGILGYASQWGFLEAEVLVVHMIRVFVDGECIYERDIA